MDHADQTVIDKNCGFDLLNPCPPQTPKPPKKKLKDFFRDLKKDRKLMVTKLKMVCAEHRCKIRNFFEDVKPIDVVGAVRQHIEILNSQEQLSRLSDAVKEKYKVIFSEIPHIDDLPMDVYCRIKLKDATKTFTTRSYSMPVISWNSGP